MTNERLIGQHMLMGLSGLSLTAEEKKFIVDNNIGGVILFARNVAQPDQILELCTEIQSLRAQMESKAPLFISIDMEGGRVARLKEPFTIWPPLRNLGILDSTTVSFEFSLAMGEELKAVGINLDYAPVLDVFTNPNNKVIGDRAVSDDPEMVAKHGSALTRGYLKAGIIPCGKHFPGHGNTLIDSHEDLPVEDATLERLEEVELIPFKKAFKAGLDLLMTAHIKFPKIDPEWPVTLSEIFLKDILRERLRYQGLVMTDDMDMKAMANHYDRKMLPVRAFQAGVDLLLYCNEPQSPPMAIESCAAALEEGWLKKEQMEASLKRILNFKAKHLKEGELLPLPQNKEFIGHPRHKELAEKMRQV